ncbi:hypothetical protein SAY87_031456 [Trapa incisa]|uniref:CASP-like protein n=1 Tax=Trapa incisa TaxID=236973 RepID=A0AAN7KTD6_9MYRT|nr:hypothetical protein SAY87_031456 [Trapa incisa]
MASTEQPVDVEAGKVKEEAPPPPPPPPEAEEEAPPKVESEAPPPPPSWQVDRCVLVDGSLRLLVFVAAVAAVVVLVTSNQKVGAVKTKFNKYPALIYFVAALSVAGFYSLVTALSSFLFLFKPICPKICLLYFVFFDVVLLGMVASATGTAGAVGYIGLKGNRHVRWGKVCNIYDTFCHHLVSSVSLSLFAAVILSLLIMLSLHSLFKKIPS